MFAMLLLLLAPPDTEPVDPRPVFQTTLRKQGDRLEILERKGVVTWRISSPRGIGGAVVTLEKGEAPRRIVIEFADLQNLEWFTLDDGQLKLESRLDRGGGKTVLHFDDHGKPVEVPARASGSLTIEKLPAGGIRVDFTCSRPGKKWTIAWINEYRN